MSQSLLINPTALEAGLEAEFVARIRANDDQRDAFMRFVKTGLPHRRMEGWKWSDFRAASREASSSLAVVANVHPFKALDAVTICLTDDGFSSDEKIDGLAMDLAAGATSSDALSDHPIVSLNAALSEQSAMLSVANGVVIPRPILLRDQRTAASSFAQFKIEVGAGARLTIIQSIEQPAAFRSLVGDLILAPQASIEHFLLSASGGGVSHVLNHATLAEKAVFHSVSLSTGSRLSRVETHLTYAGAGAECVINSAALLSGEAHADFTTHVRHDAPDCVTRQIHKGVARDRGRAVFQGKFLVNRAAQKTDAQMTANALLLSDTAEANHKPELEIYADDVECAHGSTAGSLDEDALFYMRQRGLSEHESRGLLIEAFVAEVFDAIDEVRLAEIFRGRVAAWLESGA